MNTLDELIYYCRQPVTLGALMLSGEWGCGKTYLINNDLKNALIDSHYIVRVSLFGIDSIQVLRRTIHKEWLVACLPALYELEKTHKDAVNYGKDLVERGLELAGNVTPILKKIKAFASFSDERFDHLPVQNKIKTRKGEREFVLVFDDLERTKLNVVDVLGCINAYSENKHFKTIIIANEKKIVYRPSDAATKVVVINSNGRNMGNKEKNLAYLEMKEKIVGRTVRCQPDYRQILHAILLQETRCGKEYQQFLLDNEQLIYSIFDQEQEEYRVKRGQEESAPKRLLRSRNIRSLENALQDFFRVYRCLLAEGSERLSFFLYNFIIYMMVCKNNELDYSATDEEMDDRIAQIYPMYDSRYMLQAEKDWIQNGIWDEKRIGKEEKLMQESENATEPKERLRLNLITNLDEEEILGGYEGLLEDCYAGRLSLNDYVTFIKNACYFRYYEIGLPRGIDWNRVTEGMEVRFKDDIQSKNEEIYVYQSISSKEREQYTPQELAVYDRIERFRKSNMVVFEGNKQLYLEELKKSGIRAFTICENRRFNCFDEDMARATVACYESEDQAGKRRFPIWFQSCWSDCLKNGDFDVEKTDRGLCLMKELLESLSAEYRQQGRSVTVKNTTEFIQIVDEMLRFLRTRE